MKLSLFGWILLISQAWAGPLPQPMSIERMAAESDVILCGRVVAKTCQRDEAGRIYTRVDLEVGEVWKGTVDRNVFPVVFGGGTLGEERHTIAGQVEFAVGEEVAVFAVLNQRKEGVILALGQGKFTIIPDAAGRSKSVRSRFHGPGQASLALGDLRKRVQGVLQ